MAVKRMRRERKSASAKLHGGSIKGPITIPKSSFDYLAVLSMPQVSFEFLLMLLFHGGDTGSIPVRDASNSPTTV
jgi:hypothetical protein